MAAKLDFKSLENAELLLVVAPSDSTQQVTLDILKYFVNAKNSFCVYVTVAKPYNTIMNILSKNGINTDRIFFIDCITSLSTGGNIMRAGNCVFCQPQALTNISIALTNAIESLPKDNEKLLILDTLSTLMLYNEAGTVTRFAHVLTGKLRTWGVKSVILTLEEETDKKIIAQLAQFCDKTINI